MGWAHAGTHEEHHILVARVPVRHHLSLERLELILVVSLDVNEADGHLAVPAAVVNLAEAALPDQFAYLQLLQRDVPFLQEDACLARLAREVTRRQQRQVHLLELIGRVLCFMVSFFVLNDMENINIIIALLSLFGIGHQRHKAGTTNQTIPSGNT